MSFPAIWIGLAVCVATALTGAAAVADSSFESQGIGIGVNASVDHPIDGDVTMVMSSSIFEAMTFNDPKYPLNGAIGECFGPIKINAGNIASDGYCTFDDPSGDHYVGTWTVRDLADDGVMEGDWSVLGGSGKWDGASGGGTFLYMPNDETGRFETTLTGAITLP